jgi:hypothetical protein
MTGVHAMMLPLRRRGIGASWTGSRAGCMSVDELEVTREDAELAVVTAARDERLTGLRGHHMAIALLQVLDEQGWRLMMVPGRG